MPSFFVSSCNKSAPKIGGASTIRRIGTNLLASIIAYSTAQANPSYQRAPATPSSEAGTHQDEKDHTTAGHPHNTDEGNPQPQCNIGHIREDCLVHTSSSSTRLLSNPRLCPSTPPRRYHTPHTNQTSCASFHAAKSALRRISNRSTIATDSAWCSSSV